MATAEVIPMPQTLAVRDSGDLFEATIPAGQLQTLFTGSDQLARVVARITEMAKSDPAAGDSTLLMQTKKGRDSIKSLAFKVTRSKTFLDDQGKALVAELKALPKQIDANRKAMRDALDELAAEIRRPVTEWEAHTQELSDRLNWIDGLPASLANATAAEVQAAYEKTIIFEPVSEDAWKSFFDDARTIIPRANTALRLLFEQKFKAENDAVELERLRKEKVERDQKDAEEKRIRDAAEKARQEEHDRAEHERQAALGREAEAKRQAELAEQKLAEVKRLSEERDREYQRQREAAGIPQPAPAPLTEADVLPEDREKFREHKRKCNTEAAEDVDAALCALTNTEPGRRDLGLAREVVKAIIKGQIRHVAITY